MYEEPGRRYLCSLCVLCLDSLGSNHQKVCPVMTLLDRLRRWIMRRLGVCDRYKEGFASGKHYALKLFSRAMYDANLSIYQQIRIRKFVIAADEQNQNTGKIDLQ